MYSFILPRQLYGLLYSGFTHQGTGHTGEHNGNKKAFLKKNATGEDIMIWIVLILGVILVLISAYGYKLSSKTAADYLLAGADP